MWNPNPAATKSQEEDDDSWEVKAFAEDTKNVMGTTWPPRSYTCTFCKREFRSAQALGGHMNVHRRDRARLHQSQPNLKNPNLSSSTSSTLLIPTQELVTNGGLCLLYSIPNPNAIFKTSSLNTMKAVAPHTFNSSLSNSSNMEASTPTNSKSNAKWLLIILSFNFVNNHQLNLAPPLSPIDTVLRMWNPNPLTTNLQEEDDDSWEVKAFAKDTGNVMGTTWPRRSYTCTFCRREFWSAQALGGHMNVHRHDRARLQQSQPNLKIPNLSSSSTLLIPTQERAANGGLCLFYSLPDNPSAILNPSSLNKVKVVAPHSFNSSLIEASTSTNHENNQKIIVDNKRKKTDSSIEGIDLEIRLGCNSSVS